MIAIIVNFFHFLFVDCCTSCFFSYILSSFVFYFLWGEGALFSCLPLLRFALVELACWLPQVVVVGIFDNVIEAGD